MRRLWIIAVLIVMLHTSCDTIKYVPINSVTTEYIKLNTIDSFYVHDSIDRYISGDTVYLYKYRYIYKYLNKTDTIIKTDSVEVPIEVKVTEVKEINRVKWYLSALMWLGGIFILLLSFKLSKTFKIGLIK